MDDGCRPTTSTFNHIHALDLDLDPSDPSNSLGRPFPKRSAVADISFHQLGRAEPICVSARKGESTMCSATTDTGRCFVVGEPSARTNNGKKKVDKGKKNHRFVVGSFFSSLALLIFAGAYELACRPLLRPLIGKLLENLAGRAQNCPAAPEPNSPMKKATLLFFSTGGILSSAKSNCAMSATVDKTPLYVLVSELAILLPLLLSLLPITQWWRKTFVADAKREDESNKEGIKVGVLLFIIAWALWIVAFVALVVGIMLGTARVGVISVAALLAFFAQSVASVGCLLLNSSSIEDDEMRRDAQSIGETLNVTAVKASEWLRIQKDAGSQPSEHTNNNSSSAPKRLTPMDWIMKGRNREFALFFAIKIFLLQSPFALQYGLHLLHACANCVGMGLQEDIEQSSGDSQGMVVPKEFTGLVTFCCTLLVPLFSHGVGGLLFHPESWTFHHPMNGGRSHVTAQATGWSLIGVAGLLHLAFLVFGSGHEHVFLLHSGSIVSTIAEVFLLYSLINFLPDEENAPTPKTEMVRSATSWTAREVYWLFLSFIQDFMLTNLHWFSPLWLVLGLLGIDTFHPFRASTIWGVFANASFSVVVCALPTLLIPYSPRRKSWRWNCFGHMNNAFIKFLYHRNGLFSGSVLRFEEETVDAYTQGGGTIFAITPHGILPTSVIALWHQFEEIFKDVCVFFGSQVSLVPNYRFMLGMRGGCLPVEKRRLVEVMKSNQNVALVPGGVSEMLSCIPHDPTINVSVKHKGFIRLALQQGYDLVPTVFFHASDQYNNPGRCLQLWTYSKTGIPVGIPIYCNWLLMPFSNRTPIKVALGKRIAVAKKDAPTEAEVNELHYEFYAEVWRVFEKYSEEFGYGDRELFYVP